MKREAGFSLIEMMVATTVLVIALAATLSSLTEAIHANEGVVLLADAQENLRAAMNYMVHDIVLAGEGIPQGGITIPNANLVIAANVAPPNGQSNVNMPGLPAQTFPSSYTTIPAITPGFALGEPQTTPNPNTLGAVIVGPPTDRITVIYADNTLIDANQHTLSEFPIFLAPGNNGQAGCAAGNPTPSPAGNMVVAGTTLTVTFDQSCININTGNTGLRAGDLIYLQNGTARALMTVTNVAGQTVTFLAGDAFRLNGTGQPAGTIVQMETPGNPGTFPPTTATRIWMITYYLDTATNPLQPQLMRQVNFNPPTPVGDVIEYLKITYDLTEPLLIPPVSANIQTPIWPDTTSQIRKVNLVLGARAEGRYYNNQYFRNNLATQVNVRSLCFFNQFN
jgi:prepilin-type N-terminal cleavage/methylation domain-containing protein